MLCTCRNMLPPSPQVQSILRETTVVGVARPKGINTTHPTITGTIGQTKRFHEKYHFRVCREIFHNAFFSFFLRKIIKCDNI